MFSASLFYLRNAFFEASLIFGRTRPKPFKYYRTRPKPFKYYRRERYTGLTRCSNVTILDSPEFVSLSSSNVAQM